MAKVCKFGGSSLANGEEFKQVKKIILADKERTVIVVSALGKDKEDDNKVTDLLYLIYQHRKYHVDAKPLFEMVRTRYLGIEKELGLSLNLESEFDTLWARIEHDEIDEDELVSRGEFFSAKLMANYLGFDFVDSKDLIHLDYDGKVIEKDTKDSISQAKALHQHMVIPGFYGSYPNKQICLFSRGGSDVTGSYMAKGIKAGLYENFTDVSGFYMADPKIVHSPRRIGQISYDELRELSYMGASVIHEETILPLMEDNIPLIILNRSEERRVGKECRSRWSP